MRFPLLLVALAMPAAVRAEAPRDFCPDRPGLGTPPCTMDRGRSAIEIGIADWSLEKDAGSRTDTFAFGDLLLRYGVSDRVEVQVGWTSFGAGREREAPGQVRWRSGTGDLRLALRANLANADGSGFSAALMPYATLPTGGRVLGAGDWTGGLLLPLSYQLPNGMQLGFTGRVEAAADGDRSGRHLAYGAVAGLDVPLSGRVTATFEIEGDRDDDPGGDSTQWLGGVSLALAASPSAQFDAGLNVGLGGGAPDVELYLGIARRF